MTYLGRRITAHGRERQYSQKSGNEKRGCINNEIQPLFYGCCAVLLLDNPLGKGIISVTYAYEVHSAFKIVQIQRSANMGLIRSVV